MMVFQRGSWNQSAHLHVHIVTLDMGAYCVVITLYCQNSFPTLGGWAQDGTPKVPRGLCQAIDPVAVECCNGEIPEADHLPEWTTSCVERMGFGLLLSIALR